MADTNVIQETGFDFGIQDSTVLGDVKALNDFLTGEEVAGDPADIQKIEKKEPEDKKEEDKKIDKKEEEKKPSVEDVLDMDKEEEEENKEEDKDDDKKEEPAGNAFESFSKELYDLGVLTVDEEGEEPVLANSGEELRDLLNGEKEKGGISWITNYLERFGEDRRELFDAIFVKGVDPKKYLPVYNEVEKFEGLDITTEENQELTVRNWYSKLGYDKAQIDSKIEKLKLYSDLEDEAKIVHPKLVEQEKKKLSDMKEAETAALETQREADEQYKAQINKVLAEKLKTKEFDGIPLDDKTAAKAFDFMYTKKWKLPSGELLTDFDKYVLESKNPDKIANRVKLSLLALNNFDLSKVKKKAVSQESSSLFNSLSLKDKSKHTDKKTAAPSTGGW